MRLRTVMRSFAAVGLVLIVATPIARAYIQGGTSARHSVAGPSTLETPPMTTPGREEANHLPAGKTSAPIPESAALPLVSLGLLTLGAAFWKHRGPNAPHAPARRHVHGSR